mmetsp:Transcript_120075/g.218222  ORF Transcript_120075/g.218222 Transcript_120075/m.218222 type:complete len:90 (-) Transcript_120075:2104-2373(-)
MFIYASKSPLIFFFLTIFFSCYDCTPIKAVCGFPSYFPEHPHTIGTAVKILMIVSFWNAFVCPIWIVAERETVPTVNCKSMMHENVSTY